MSDLFTVERRYPQAPGYKVRGASRDAARKITPFANTVRARVLRAYVARHPAGMTADEVAAATSISPFTIRPRVSELAADRLIEETPHRRENGSGHNATVWRASPQAMEAVNAG